MIYIKKDLSHKIFYLEKETFIESSTLENLKKMFYFSNNIDSNKLLPYFVVSLYKYSELKAFTKIFFIDYFSNLKPLDANYKFRTKTKSIRLKGICLNREIKIYPYNKGTSILYNFRGSSNIFTFLEITMFNIIFDFKTLRKILKLIKEISNDFLF